MTRRNRASRAWRCSDAAPRQRHQAWKDAASFCDHINLYGFWNETTFLTKSGDLGVVLRVAGVDYESLDHGEQEYAVKRLEAALKSFGPGFHVYQYLFKTNRPEIPFARYENPVVQESSDFREQLFHERRTGYSRSKSTMRPARRLAVEDRGGAGLRSLPRDPAGAINELKAQFTNKGMKTLLRSQIERDLARLEQQVQAFVRQLTDLRRIELFGHKSQFRFFRRLVNYDDWRVDGEPKLSQFLDRQIAIP